MNLTTKQIKRIIDGVPEGATHYVTCTDDYLDYVYNTLFYGGEWYKCNMDTIAEPHDISDLREILTLRQRVQELESQQSEVVARAVENAVKKYKLPSFAGPDIFSEGLLDYANQLRRQGDV